MMAGEVEKAERMSRVRAVLMALGAAILLLNLFLEYGDPRYSSGGARGAARLLLIGLWTFILWNGGGVRLNRRVCALLNDELSLRNRSRAIAVGFYAVILGSLALFVLNWSVPIATGDALKIVSGGGLCVALASYAWLEWR